MEDCVFCKIVSGEIPDYRVWEDDKFVAFLDIHPISDGHTLVIPRAHTDSVFDLVNQDYVALFEIGKSLAPAIQKVTKCKRVGMALEGLSVPHVHLHLVPVNNVNDLDPNKAHSLSPESMADMQTKLKAALS